MSKNVKNSEILEKAPPTLSQERAEILDFIEGQRAESTVQKTSRDIERFKKYFG